MAETFSEGSCLDIVVVMKKIATEMRYELHFEDVDLDFDEVNKKISIKGNVKKE